MTTGAVVNVIPASTVTRSATLVLASDSFELGIEDGHGGIARSHVGGVGMWRHRQQFDESGQGRFFNQASSPANPAHLPIISCGIKAARRP